MLTFPKYLRVIRQILITISLFFLNSVFYGQNLILNRGKVFEIETILNNTSAKGDTFSITVKNLTPYDRGFTLEVVELSDNPYYFNAVYSAYINQDTSFFRKLRAAKKSLRQNHIKYILPDFATRFYNIKGNLDTTVKFIIKGNLIPQGKLIRLRLTSDIVNGESETLYSDAFKVFALPY